jgi:hypothetical protein
LIGTATDELESGVRNIRRGRLHFVFVMHRLRTAGNVVKKGKKGKIEFDVVMHKLRTAGNVGKRGKKGKIEFCICHSQIKDSW